jgi:hypothetical protein
MTNLLWFSDSPGPVSGRLRSGQGWQERTTTDVPRKILYVYPAHVKKVLALALLSSL